MDAQRSLQSAISLISVLQLSSMPGGENVPTQCHSIDGISGLGGNPLFLRTSTYINIIGRFVDGSVRNGFRRPSAKRLFNGIWKFEVGVAASVIFCVYTLVIHVICERKLIVESLAFLLC
jgi:hypothetical protein